MTLQWVSKIMSIGVAGITTMLSLSPNLAVSKPTVVSTPTPIVISRSDNNNGVQASREKISVEISEPVKISNDWTEIVSIIAIVAGGFWAFFTFTFPLLGIFREVKLWIQFDIDANLYRLSPAKKVVITYSYNKDQDTSGKGDGKGELQAGEIQTCEHAVEVLLKLKNKGKIRFKLYNLQFWINTIPNEWINTTPDGKNKNIECDRTDGHLKLHRIFTSGNIVPKMKSECDGCDECNSQINKHSCYYIEPNVEQTIHHLIPISEPKELLQVVAEFSLEQKRIFPQEEQTKNRGFLCKLYPLPHKAVRTYQIDSTTKKLLK